MRASHVPLALRDRLGNEATVGLVELLDSSSIDWSEHVLTLAAERFERRLTQEISGLRVDLAQMQSSLLKWSFLFWVGQVAAMVGLLAFMLRATGR